MKAIMISIKPEWVRQILNGEKTIEIRKTMPKCDLPIDVYIYCTKSKPRIVDLRDDAFYLGCSPRLNGKVVAKFTLNKVEEIICRPICGEWESYTKTLGYSEISQVSCLKNREIVHYLKGKNGYAWHIDNLEIFDKPKELSEFKRFVWLRNEYIFPNPVCDMCEFPHCKDCARHYCLVPLTKAPQNFCYVEVE